MSTPALKLKPNAPARILAGHPWVFANEVEALLPASYDGEAQGLQFSLVLYFEPVLLVGDVLCCYLPQR